VASKVLRAQITIDDYQTSVMDKVYLKEYVINTLLDQMRTPLQNEMIIQNVGNPNIGTSTYTGTLHVGSGTSGTIIGSGYNTAIAGAISENPLTLRVVEFTKKGKVTRVELQYYVESGWQRVPRIQIEEK
jgi:hypothetical protein